MMKYYLTFVFYLTALVTSFGQNTDFVFHHLGVKDGLSQGWIRCIYQDRYGFLWFGTGDGLNKFDGYKFTVYRSSVHNHNSLINNNIRKIYEDSKGNIWIGTQGGLSLYNREQDNMKPIASTFQHSVEDIVEDRHGNLFLAGPEGLFILNTRTFKLKPLIRNIYINAILKNKDGNLWLGTYNGLFLMNTDNYSCKIIPIKKSVSKTEIDTNIRSMCWDSYGRIWMGTNNSGLLLMKFKDHNYEKPVITNYVPWNEVKTNTGMGAVLSLMDDHKGHLWIGIENGGLDIINLNDVSAGKCVFKHYQNIPANNSSLSNNSIQSLYKDDQNTVWVGTYRGGLNYYNKLLQQFKTVRMNPLNKNSIRDNHVNVLYNEKNYLWIGTEGGLDVLNKKNDTYRHYEHENDNPGSLGANAVWSIFRDSKNNMWIGTWAGGLNLLNEKTHTFKHFLYQPNNNKSIGGNNIFRVIEDDQHQLWIASMGGGLNKYDPKTGNFQRFLNDNRKNSISNNWVSDIMTYGSDEIWLATSISVDVYNRKTGKFYSFQHDSANKKSLSGYGAVGFYKDSKKHIWIATTSGLDLFHRKDSSFTYYTVDDGLPNNSINAICEDSHGNLWLSTNKGISEFIQGIHCPVKPEFKNYDMSDGLQGNEFIRLSVCKDKRGNIYFGGTNGFTFFNPDSLRDNPTKPKVVFTNFLVYNKPAKIGAKNSPLKQNINLTHEITLTHKYLVFSIKYAALSYIASDKNHYAFTMEGFDKGWNYVGNQRTATYTHLDPGQYIFKVKACNNDGLWNNKYTSLIINILPPWWMTKLAKIIYIVLILLVLYFLRKYTLISIHVKNQLWKEHIEKEKAEELNRMKIQFFTNISHELRTPLSLLLSPVNRLIKKGASSKEIKLISRNASRLKAIVDQILDFQKIENNQAQIKLVKFDVIEFIKDLLFDFSGFSEDKNIRLSFETTVSELYILADKDKLEKIVTNLLSNAIKNTSDQGMVTIRLTWEHENDNDSGVLQLELEDNGKGIPENEIDKIFDRFFTSSNYDYTIHGAGIGLHLTKKLIELLSGTITVQSTVGKGTTFTVSLPCNTETENTSSSKVPENYTESRIYTPTTEVRKIDVISSHKQIVLIIDDNRDICDYLESILRDEYTVVKENNPLKAMELVLQFMPDIIISDVMMPGMNGYELCKKLKTDMRFSHIPVILLTARSTAEDHITGLDIGADDYINKPFNDDILASRIRNLLQQRDRLRAHFIGDNDHLNKTFHPLDKLFVDKVIQIVKENYHDSGFTVNTIIEGMAMSRSVFYKKYKALSDQSINDLITNYRLKRATELLRTNNYSMNEIAFMTGFSDQAYFSKVFKKHYRVSPKDFTSGTDIIDSE